MRKKIIVLSYFLCFKAMGRKKSSRKKSSSSYKKSPPRRKSPGTSCDHKMSVQDKEVMVDVQDKVLVDEQQCSSISKDQKGACVLPPSTQVKKPSRDVSD